MYKTSKTRIAYHTNLQSSLTKSTADGLITLNTPSNSDNTLGYRVARIKNDTHGWHSVPWNHWYLYLSKNEVAALMYYYKSIKPKKIKLSISHCIPIAKYPTGTGTTTGLSFNNTIYSWIYKNVDTSNVIADEVFDTYSKLENFCRTYDGAAYEGGRKLDIPQSDLLYKVPTYKETIANADVGTTDLLLRPFAANAIYAGQNVNKLLTDTDLKLEFLPEFLKDNQNVYVLYPGENQFVEEFEIPDNDYTYVDWSAIKFNEDFNNLDQRGQRQLNSNEGNSSLEPDDLCHHKIVCRLRNYDLTRNNGNDATNRRQDDIYFNQTQNFDSNGPPEIYIKGVPILDPDGNLIQHTFHDTITWEIEIEGIPNDFQIPRPIIEGWANLRLLYYANAAGALSSLPAFTQDFPLRMTQQHFRQKVTKARFVPYDATSVYTVTTNDVATVLAQEQHMTKMQRENRIANVKPADGFVKTTPPARTLRSNTQAPAPNIPSHHRKRHVQ